jgi:lysozyme family protein
MVAYMRPFAAREKIEMTPFYASLRDGYASLWQSMAVLPRNKLGQVNTAGAIVDKLSAAGYRSRYDAVSAKTGVPWWWIAITHELEAGASFTQHLHNGDSLKRRTVNVPAGRPAEGFPPFSWEMSAEDALRMHALDKVASWDVTRALYEFERYNGFGYRNNHAIETPYLWSFSNHYSAGKYVSDGVYSGTAVSQQIGAAIILRTMIDRGIVAFPDLTPTTAAPPSLPAAETRPANPPGYLSLYFAGLIARAKTFLRL